MKKILAFLALASMAQFAAAATTGYDFDTAGAVESGSVVFNPVPTSGATVDNTCTVLSAEEPPVTINLSRQVLAAMHCNTTTNAVGGATQHPGGRPAACSDGTTSGRCAYLATTAGGPVVQIPAPGGVTPPTSGADLAVCASTISAVTGGAAPATCQ